MRLSQLAQERGIDAFEFDDFLFVSNPLRQDPARLVLIGGQALETWGHFFHVMPPTGNTNPLTEDTDFLGSRQDAKWLCAQLGKEDVELILAKDFDPSPNTAIAYLKRPDGRILMIDFLYTVMGLSDSEVRSMAVRATIAGNTIYILHPLMCLKSRLANLEKLPAKRNTNGVMQANWAILIVNAYLRKLLEDGAKQKELISQFSTVSEIAEFKSGPYCYKTFGIDPLKAITPDMVDRVGEGFATKDWPIKLARIARKRATQSVSMTVRFSDLSSAHKVPNIEIPANLPLAKPRS